MLALHVISVLIHNEYEETLILNLKYNYLSLSFLMKIHCLILEWANMDRMQKFIQRNIHTLGIHDVWHPVVKKFIDLHRNMLNPPVLKYIKPALDEIAA
jgi:hypothetical protein